MHPLGKGKMVGRVALSVVFGVLVVFLIGSAQGRMSSNPVGGLYYYLPYREWLTSADPGEAGPYAIAHITITTTNPNTGSNLETDIYYPSLDGTVNPSGAPYATLVFAPGFLANPSSYPGNGEHLASWGYIVAIPDFPDEDIEVRASDVQHLFTYLEAENADRDSRFFQKIDTDRFGLTGHSLGGLSTMMVAARDKRIKVAVALDPTNPPESLTGNWDYEEEAPDISAPLAVIGAPAQPCNLDANYNDMYPLVGSPHKAKFVIANGSHCDFMDTDNFLHRFSCYFLCGGEFSEDRVRLTERYTTAWFNYYLHGDTGYYTYLFGTGLNADVKAGLIIPIIETAPRDFQAATTGRSVHLSWRLYDIPLVSGYNIYRSETEGKFGTQPMASVGRITAYEDLDVIPGHTYYYALASYDPAGQEHSRAFAGPVTIPVEGSRYYLPIIYQARSTGVAP